MAIADGQGRPGQAMTSHDNDNGRLMTLPRRSSRRLAVSPSPPSAPLRTQAPGRAAGQQARQSSKGAPLTWPCFADRRLKRAAEPRPCTRSLCATGRLISISTSAPHPTTARAARTARTATCNCPNGRRGVVAAGTPPWVSPRRGPLRRWIGPHWAPNLALAMCWLPAAATFLPRSRHSTADRRPSSVQCPVENQPLLDCACSQRRRGGFQGSSN
jgi:hypothetical protein